MKRILLLLLVSLLPATLLGQQIALKGIVTVQNSRVNTGKTEYVSEASVSHPNAKPTATDSRGAFTLQILRLKSGAQTAIEVKPTGRYKDYVVVDERLIKDITLGRTTPVGICVQDRRVLEERERRLIAVTVKKQNEIRERKIAELNRRIAALEAANDYANEQYQRTIDSLTILANDKSEAIKRIRAYAKDMVLINLDEADSVYRRAYQFFEEGELDSVASYLRQHIDFEAERKQIEQQMSEARDKKSLARELDEQADRQLANAEQAQEQLVKKLLLAAKASAELYNHTEAMLYYEQALALAPENPIIMSEYGTHLCGYNRFEVGLKYLLKAKDIMQYQKQSYAKEYHNLVGVIGFYFLRIKRYSQSKLYLSEYLCLCDSFENMTISEKLDRSYILQSLGEACEKTREKERANTCYSEAVAIQEEIISLGNSEIGDVSYRITLRNLANLSRDSKKSEQYLQKLYNFLSAISKENLEQNLSNYRSYAGCLLSFSRKFLKEGECSKAKEYIEQAIYILEDLSKRMPVLYRDDFAFGLRGYTSVLLKCSEKDLARQAIEKSMRILDQLMIENPMAHYEELTKTIELYIRHFLEDDADDEYQKNMLYRRVQEYSRNMLKEDENVHFSLMTAYCDLIFRFDFEKIAAKDFFLEILDKYERLDPKDRALYIEDLIMSYLVLEHYDWIDNPRKKGYYIKKGLEIMSGFSVKEQRAYIDKYILLLSMMSMTYVDQEDYQQAKQSINNLEKVISTHTDLCVADMRGFKSLYFLSKGYLFKKQGLDDELKKLIEESKKH